MSIIGNYYPIDNSFCINCRNGKDALIVPGCQDKEEENANFIIVSEPYEEEIYFYGKHSYTFINVQSSKTGNIYRTLFINRGLL